MVALRKQKTPDALLMPKKAENNRRVMTERLCRILQTESAPLLAGWKMPDFSRKSSIFYKDLQSGSCSDSLIRGKTDSQKKWGDRCENVTGKGFSQAARPSFKRPVAFRARLTTGLTFSKKTEPFHPFRLWKFRHITTYCLNGILVMHIIFSHWIKLFFKLSWQTVVRKS